MSKYVADAKEFFDALTGEETRWSGAVPVVSLDRGENLAGRGRPHGPGLQVVGQARRLVLAPRGGVGNGRLRDEIRVRRDGGRGRAPGRGLVQRPPHGHGRRARNPPPRRENRGREVGRPHLRGPPRPSRIGRNPWRGFRNRSRPPATPCASSASARAETRA